MARAPARAPAYPVFGDGARRAARRGDAGRVGPELLLDGDRSARRGGDGGLRTYYVGYGGNHNTTTRFRRYDGAGARPLLPEHDLGAPAQLLEEGREYRIEITVAADGRTTWARDGEVLFDHTDPEPLREGWFGLRTVWARLEVRDFVVERL